MCAKTIFLLLLILSPLAIAEVPFEHVILDKEGPKDPWAKITGDIDGDGFVDVIIGLFYNRPHLIAFRWDGIPPT